MIKWLKFRAKMLAVVGLLLIFLGIMGGLGYWLDCRMRENALEAVRQDYRANIEGRTYGIRYSWDEGEPFSALLGRLYFVKADGRMTRNHYEIDQGLEGFCGWPIYSEGKGQKRSDMVFAHLFLPDRPMSNEDIRVAFEKRQWRPATLPELVAFHLCNPQFPSKGAGERICGGVVATIEKCYVPDDSGGGYFVGPWRIERVGDNAYWINETYDRGKHSRHGKGWPLSWLFLAVEK